MTDTAPVDILINTRTWLTVRTTLTGIGPESALTWFLDNEKILRWWGQEAAIDPVVGGTYEVRWPRAGYILRGEIVDLGPTEATISWWFLHEPELPTRMMRIRTEAVGEDTVVTIIHGPYSQSPSFPREDDDRQSHIDGWSHFLPLLQQAIAG